MTPRAKYILFRRRISCFSRYQLKGKAVNPNYITFPFRVSDGRRNKPDAIKIPNL